MVKNILENLCPACGEGKVFTGLFTIGERCPNCGYKFERESGYFYGAIFIHYSLLAVLVLPFMALGFIMQGSLWTIVGICTFVILAVSPFLFRLSRLIWLNADYKADPGKPRS